MPIQILMPALSPTMTEGTLAKWLVKEGDNVKAGDILAEIETDKATMEFEAVDEGRIGKILIQAGTENIAVNTPIAVLLEEGEDASSIKTSAAPAPAAKPVVTDAPKTAAAPAPTVAPTAKAPAPQLSSGNRLRISPLAKRIAEQAGIDYKSLGGSGPHGRIVKADIEAALAGGGAPKKAPAAAAVQAGGTASTWGRPAQEFEEVPLNNMRKTIARRLLEAKTTIPHFYLTMDFRLDALMELRAKVNARLDAKVSVNDFIIKASALALRKVPDANACWGGDKILKYHVVDVAVAVALDGGLITPLIRDADKKSVAQIAAEMKDLAARARAGKLKPEEYQGGSFSISNLGMYGIRDFAAVINPPHGSILAVGAGEKRAVVADDGSIKAANIMTGTLSCDHRVIDGALGAQWLGAFKELIEDPIALLL